MTDKLIERLRAGFQPYETITLGGVKHDPRCLEAAVHIEALEAKNAQLRGLLDSATNGIEWYRDEHPESWSEADEEFLSQALRLTSGEQR